MLKAKQLSKQFGERWALRDLDLEIGAGEIRCLLGANGAGKSTTINLFLGFLEPSRGAAYVDGRNVASDVRAARVHLAYLPEQVSLYPTLTGLENLLYFTRLAGKHLRDAAVLRPFFDRVGLSQEAADVRVERYSKGMRQKVGLAIALAKQAKGLLLDEPLSGLDPRAASEFCRLLRNVADGGAAVLMVTHDLFRAKEIGDRVGIMKDGRLVEDVTPASLTHAQLERMYLDCMSERT